MTNVSPGKLITIVSMCLQDVSPGFVLCAPDNLCHTVKTFDAQVS